MITCGDLCMLEDPLQVSVAVLLRLNSLMDKFV